jgi:hypothetical protein
MRSPPKARLVQEMYSENPRRGFLRLPKSLSYHPQPDHRMGFRDCWMEGGIFWGEFLIPTPNCLCLIVQNNEELFCLWRFLCLLAFIFLLSPLYFPKGGK